MIRRYHYRFIVACGHESVDLERVVRWEGEWLITEKVGEARQAWLQWTLPEDAGTAAEGDLSGLALLRGSASPGELFGRLADYQQELGLGKLDDPIAERFREPPRGEPGRLDRYPACSSIQSRSRSRAAASFGSRLGGGAISPLSHREIVC